MNGDGKQDLVVVGYENGSIFLGNGDGTFQSPTVFSPGFYLADAVIADLNGDNKADIVVTNSGTNNVSYVNAQEGGYARLLVEHRRFLDPSHALSAIRHQVEQQIYLDGPLSRDDLSALGMPRQALHNHRVVFVSPASRERVEVVSPLQADMAAYFEANAG